MKIKYLSIVIFALIFLLFSFAFYFQNLKKGSFYSDEPLIVEMARYKNRNLVQIFNGAAWMAQPPLEFIIREKIFTPLGTKLGLAARVPELFQRSLSLLWWLIPISYFALFLKDYSTKNRLIILLTFVLLGSSDFLGFYLTEAKGYSGIAAVFFSMVLIMLSDKTKIQKWGIRFLVVASLFPLLHIISFLYYISVICLFLLYYYISFKNKKKFFQILLVIVIYLVLIFSVYVAIQRTSAPYQQSGLANLTKIENFDSHLKWTMQWVFYSTPFFVIFEAIPGIIINNLFPIFLEIGVPTAIYVINKIRQSLSSKNPALDVTIIFPLIITLLWPITDITVFYQSGLFAGERYSIVILVTTLFYISTLMVHLIYKLTSNKNYQITAVVALFVPIAYLGLAGNLKYWRPKIATAENIFVRDNPTIINNSDNYIISDMGAYSSSIQSLGSIIGAVFNANYIHCRLGIFQKDGKSVLNEWIAEHKNNNVYFLSSGLPLNPENKIVWQYQYLTLYKVTKIDESVVCNNQNRLGNCYERCTKGTDLSFDRLRLPHTTPFLDDKNL